MKRILIVLAAAAVLVGAARWDRPRTMAVAVFDAPATGSLIVAPTSTQDGFEIALGVRSATTGSRSVVVGVLQKNKSRIGQATMLRHAEGGLCEASVVIPLSSKQRRETCGFFVDFSPSK